jgi:hypothetical protein
VVARQPDDLDEDELTDETSPDEAPTPPCTPSPGAVRASSAAAAHAIDTTSPRCLAEPAVFPSVVESLALGWSSFTTDLGEGALGERLVQNTPAAAIEAPLLIGQGEADPLVLRRSGRLRPGQVR